MGHLIGLHPPKKAGTRPIIYGCKNAPPMPLVDGVPSFMNNKNTSNLDNHVLMNIRKSHLKKIERVTRNEVPNIIELTCEASTYWLLLQFLDLSSCRHEVVGINVVGKYVLIFLLRYSIDWG
jgi:hypothetical protein